MKLRKISDEHQYLCKFASEAIAAFRRGYETWFSTSDAVLQPLTVGSDGIGNVKIRIPTPGTSLRQEANRAFEKYRSSLVQSQAVSAVRASPRPMRRIQPMMPVDAGTTPPTPKVPNAVVDLQDIGTPPPPLRVNNLHRAYSAFLDSPRRVLLMEVPEPPVQAVSDAIREDMLVSVHGGSLCTGGRSSKIVSFFERHAFFDRALSRDSQPPMFAKLYLQFLGMGATNSVWTVTPRSATPGILELFPEELREHVIQQDIVFRFPMPLVPASTVEDVRDEIVALVEADMGGYGQRAVMLAHRRCMTENDEEEGTLQPGMQLVAVMGRASKSCYDTVRYMQPPQSVVGVLIGDAAEGKPWTTKGMEDYFMGLQRAVWHTSVRGIVHVDGTLTNFMDTRHKDGSYTVSSTDLDPVWYRRMEPFDAKTGSREWIVVWYYNVLFTSCRVRSNCRPEVWPFWMTKRLRRALVSVHEEIQKIDRETCAPTMCHYLAMIDSMRWYGTGPHCGVEVGNTEIDLARGEQPEMVAKVAVEITKFYNIEQLYGIGITSMVEKARGARSRMATVSSASCEWLKSERKLKDANRWFDSFYRCSLIPMLRLFSIRLDHGQSRGAFEPKLLCDVLFEYATASQSDLEDVFLEERRPDKASGQMFRRVPTSKELTNADLEKPLVVLGFLSDRPAWRGSRNRVGR